MTDPDDELVFDDDFIRSGPREPSAQERLAKAQRIAREHARLERAGEIASGTGKPAFRQRNRRSLFLLLAAGLALGIILLAVVVTR